MPHGDHRARFGARRHPHLVERSKRLYHKLVLGPVARRAAAIIAVSEATRRDVIHFLGVPASRVYEVDGADSRFAPQPNSEVERVRLRYGLHTPFVLAVGFAQPRKNLPNLLLAHRALFDRGHRHELILVGPGSPGPLPAGVRSLGYVPEEDLPGLYSAARACALVSISRRVWSAGGRGHGLGVSPGRLAGLVTG